MISTMHFRLANFDAYTEEVSEAVADSLKDKIDDIVEESIETQVTPVVDRVVGEAVQEQVPALVNDIMVEKMTEVEAMVDTKISDFSDEIDSKMDEIDEKIAHIPTEEHIQGMIDTSIEGKPDTDTVSEMITEAISGIQPGVTEERVYQIISGETQTAAAEGQFDDTKVYPSYAVFPGNELYSGSEEPREDVLYIDQSTGHQYTWSAAEEEYIPLFGTISDNSIEQLVNS